MASSSSMSAIAIPSAATASRGTVDDDDNDDERDRRDTIAAFPALPEELIKLIFEHACQTTTSSACKTDTARDSTNSKYTSSEDASTSAAAAPGASVAPQRGLDVQTALALMLVSRAAYNLVVPLLYRSVTIARPSQLVDLANTILLRPSLGLLVRNLWVGSLDSPSLNYLPLIISNVEYVEAAKAHITRFEQRHGSGGGSSSSKPRIHHAIASDPVYIETGVDFAAMNVPPYPDRLVQLQPSASSSATTRHSSSRMNQTNGIGAGERNERTSASDWDAASVSSRATSANSGHGVDRLSLGYDAAGDWIGMDDWMLRCLEVQYAIEFHWEWVGITSPAAVRDQEDEDAKQNDPMDWADATEAVSALPSRQREFSSETMASSSTTEYLRSNASKIGFAHIQQFYSLRKAGHSPREAARILIQRYVRATYPGTCPALSDVCNIDMLADERESDHFLHPALFARSGAIHLIVPAEAPEGINAPPNAVPAPAAAMTVFHDELSTADVDSSDDEGRETQNATAAAGLEGWQQSGTSDNVLDFIDLFGHIPISSRTLYSGVEENASLLQEGRDIELSQTLTQSYVAPQAARRDQQVQDRKRQPFRRLLRPPPTLGSLVANLRAILAMCPRIRVLGLNGFLERAVGGSRQCAALSELRHLSLGPPPPFWSSALNLHQRTLHSLRSLHISGCMLFRSEAMAIGGFTPALPHLREVDWTLWLGHVLEHPINVVDALSYLLGKDGSTGSNGDNSTISVASRRLERVQRRKPLRAVRATLNAEDVAFWQRHAHTDLASDARLQLRACASKDIDVNLRAVRQWWERKAGLL